MAVFPSRDSAGDVIYPTSRTISPGQYPVKIYRSLSGKTIRRSYGSRPSSFVLELTFQNVNNNVVQAIVEHYQGQYGSTVGFSIPSTLLIGLNNTLQGYLRNPSSTDWYYSNPPNIEAVLGGYSNVSISLIAELT
jgi:hypothetical protein